MDSPYVPKSYRSSLARLLLRLNPADMYQVTMNRFLTRKKDRALDDHASGAKKAKKWKKGQPEPEPKIDLSIALPSTADFRTSLIMPTLSTRFSMLREQDDPSSKLGKASDDSVLHPKRQSRLHEFGFAPGGLSDIAEVSSLRGSIRPPFANERHGSFDSQSTEEGSANIMTRSRPGEGNVLFGGRQKVYKVSNTGTSKGLGRVLYDDDIHMSAFQKLRQQEKDRLREKEQGQEQGAQDGHKSDPPSPTQDAYSPSPSGLNQRRETSSSTNSGTTNARSSTAATSIASQRHGSVPALSPALPGPTTPLSPTEPHRPGTKARRLYDQALDQHMHEQQSSAMNRLNSIQRTRAPTGRSTPPLSFSQTRSATNLSDRFNRTTLFRTDAPNEPSNGKDTQSNSPSPVISRPHSPPLASPLVSDSEDAQILKSALQPNDRGKATAMGTFNKPKQAFNEQQYAERLQQLQKEREVSAQKTGIAQKPSLRERAKLEQQKRAVTGEDEPTETGATEPFESGPLSEKKTAPSPFSVFQSALNQMKTSKTSKTSTANDLPSPPAQRQQSPQNLKSPDSQHGTTFFVSSGSSDGEEDTPEPALKASDLDRRFQKIPTATGPAPPILDHPALRSMSSSQGGPEAEHPAPLSHSNSRPAPKHLQTQPSPSEEPHTDFVNKEEDPGVDSPTLGPTTGGLSGLIRQHLRNVSTISSEYGEGNQFGICPPPIPGTNSLFVQTQNTGPQARQAASETNTATHSGYSHSNPWDLDDLDNTYHDEGASISSTSPVDAYKPKPQNLRSNPTSLPTTTQAINETLVEWEKEIVKAHKREPSLEEREAFHRELALRQRAIQESLNNQAPQSLAPQTRSRNASPAPAAPAAPAAGGGLMTALNMLRAKSSKESFATLDTKAEAPVKAIKMLGLGSNSANASNISLAGPKPARVLQQSEQDVQREMASRQRSTTNESSHHPRSKSRNASSDSSARNRSSSEVSSGRTRGGPQYRDDLEQAMAEGTGSKTTAYPPNASPSIPGYVANATPPLPAERPSLDSQGRMRSRSNSRTAAASYFEAKHLLPIQTSSSANGSPRLTPGFSPGLPVSPRPSLGAAPSPNIGTFRPQTSPFPPFSASNTPPVSGTSTPVAPAFNMPITGTLRKKSIAKSNISEPIFISTTSIIDTVSLPPGASLRNGVESPPPLPPINPMRRRFGFGRSAADDPGIHTPSPPYAKPVRTASSEALASMPSQSRHRRLKRSTSEGKSLHEKMQVPAGASPAMPSAARNVSPPRPLQHNSNPSIDQSMDGAMF